MPPAPQLRLSERLIKPVKQPKELTAWSLSAKEFYADDRQLRYFYLPDPELDRGLNLLTGFQSYNPADLDKPDGHLDDVLQAVETYERLHGRIGAQVFTWRGILRQILSLAVFPGDEDTLDYNVVHFDGQVFIEMDAASRKRESFDGQEKFMYGGFNFEKIATLSKPWGETTRDEINARYKGTYKSDGEYGILVSSGIDSTRVVFGAEVDCVEGDKDSARPLAHYMELKTSAAVRDQRGAAKLEKKLFRTWLQCFLAGIPKVVYGFRDQQFNLVAVEEYKTSQIPTMIKQSTSLPPEWRWNGNHATGFYGAFLAWLLENVKPNKTYKLRWVKGRQYLELIEAPVVFEGREVAFLTQGFVQWRREARAVQEDGT